VWSFGGYDADLTFVTLYEGAGRLPPR
jgi:hypothetical protein